jgi:hypothetical protein
VRRLGRVHGEAAVIGGAPLILLFLAVLVVTAAGAQAARVAFERAGLPGWLAGVVVCVAGLPFVLWGAL